MRTRPLRRLERLVPAAVLAAAVAACGSTVPTGAAGPVGGAGLGGDASGGSTGAGTGVTPGTTGGGSTGTIGASEGTGGAGQAGSSGTVGTTGGGIEPSPSTNGLGVTDTTLAIGITYTKNTDAANKAIGAAGLTSGDTLADAKAVVAEVNARGGVAGRRLVAYYTAYDANSSAPYASQDSAACAALTQDHRVVAVLGAGLTETFAQCVAHAGAIQISAGQIVNQDDAYMRQHRNFFLLGTMTQDRMMRGLVRSWQSTGWFGGWDALRGRPGPMPAHLGVITFDTPESLRPLRGTLLPELKRIGHPVADSDVYIIHAPGSTQEQGPSIAALKGATLKMQQDGVTHAVLLDTNGGVLLLFANNARTQGYYPRYGLDSGSGVQAIYDQGTISNKQLNGAAGIGWVPFLDLRQEDGDRYATAATKSCLNVMKQRTGQTYTSTNAASIALGYCDSVFMTALALNRAKVLSPAGLAAAIEGLGHAYQPASVPASFFSPARHDEADLGWDLTWDTTCECARYAHGHRVL